jgi:hypothetical protein
VERRENPNSEQEKAWSSCSTTLESGEGTKTSRHGRTQEELSGDIGPHSNFSNLFYFKKSVWKFRTNSIMAPSQALCPHWFFSSGSATASWPKVDGEELRCKRRITAPRTSQLPFCQDHHGQEARKKRCVGHPHAAEDSRACRNTAKQGLPPPATMAGQKQSHWAAQEE